MTRPGDIAAGVPAKARAVLVTDLGALVANWSHLASVADGADCAAVVKADAYGLGATHVVPALRAAGCTTFFVATLDEGIAVSDLAPDSVVYVLDGVLSGTEAAFGPRLRPVLNSVAQVALWRRTCSQRGASTPAGLHIDTGMSRLGVAPERLPDALKAGLLDAQISLVMTHPACADDPDDAMTLSQFIVFEEAASAFNGAQRSFANSPATVMNPDFHCDLVRAGIAIYGGVGSLDGTALSPVVSLYARVLQTRDVPSGTPVGYGATFVTQRPSRLATLGLGYADGYQRAITTQSDHDNAQDAPNVCFGRYRAPVVGRVSMDTIVVDITDIADTLDANPTEGDFAEVIGPNVALNRLSGAAGTIDYEILTGLRHARAHRIWIGADH